jgi:hypothetical protein
MRIKALKNESWIAFLNSYTLQKILPKLVSIRRLKQIWSLFDSSQMAIENATNPFEATEIHN